MHVDLLDALSRAGFDMGQIPAQPNGEGFYRFPAPGKKRPDTSGYLKIFDDGTGATFGVWGGEKFTWHIGASNDNFTVRDRQEIDRKRAQAEAKRRTAADTAAEQARWIWEHAQPCNDNHPYLTAKGITGAGLRIDRRGRLLVPVVADPDGPVVNLQRIDRDGEKRPITGGVMGGAFHIIPGTGAAIYCEGYATGATLHAATGRPVVVTFFADNLPTVAAKLALPDAVVAADNDNALKPGTVFRRKPETWGKGHKVAMATGLLFWMPATPGNDWNDQGIEATRAAFASTPTSALPVVDPWQLDRVEIKGRRDDDLARALSRVTTPEQAAATAWTVAARLSIRAPAQMPLIGIRQFIESNLPPLLAHPATLDGIVGRLAKAQSYRKRAALAAVTIPDDVLARHRHEQRHDLPTLTGDDWRGVVVVRAPMGSGKTQRIGQPFAEWAKTQGKVLAICHRVSLVAELAHRLALTHYGDLPADIAWAADGLATCLPSITRPEHAGFVDRAEYVFIDEIAQVLRFLEAEKHCRTRTATNAGVMAKLRAIVAQARVVVVADAGADRRTIEFLESCRPGERFRIIEMIDPTSNGIEATYTCGAQATTAVVGAGLAELEAGGNVWLAVEGKDRTKALGRFFAEQGFEVLAVHADNKANAAQATFLASPEAESRRYRVVIASPVIGSGLSIEHADDPHFTLGGFIGGGSRLTPADAAQMLRRVRYLDRFVLGFLPNTTVGAQDPDAIIQSWETAARIEGQAVTATDFDRLVARIRADEQNARADFAAGLLWQLDRAGWSLSLAQDVADDATGAAIKAASKAEEDRHRAALLSARILTTEEADAIERKAERTEAEAVLIEAQRIRRVLNVDQLDDDTLDFWDRGAVVRRMDRFAAAQGVVGAHDDTGDTLARRRYWRACARAYGFLFQGIDLSDGEWLTPEVAEEIVGRVMERRHLLAHLGVVGAEFGVWREDRDGNLLPMQKPAHPVKEVGKILERMGLAIEGRQVRRCHTSAGYTLGSSGACVTPKGNPRARVYRVTTASWARMADAVDRRNAGRNIETVAQFRPVPAVVGRIMADPAIEVGAIIQDLAQGRRTWRDMQRRQSA
ncbi:MAG: plasmid replication protein, CyRepA1 family [Rhodobacterales bacterium]